MRQVGRRHGVPAMVGGTLAVVLACGGDDGGGNVGHGGSSSTGAATFDDSADAPMSTTASPGDSGTVDSSSADSSPVDSGDTTGDDGPADSSGSTGAPGPANASLGCGTALDDPQEVWNPETVEVEGVTREYWMWFPPGYDPQTPYPIVYQFHGCSSADTPQDNNPPVQNESGPDAIHVRGRAVADCWDAAPGGPDVAFFDELVLAVESVACVDTERRFATGYSSGSFMSHRLSCERGEMLRGVATIAGGSGGNDCEGKVAALLIHDDTDPQVGIGASIAARDLNLSRNGCDIAEPTTATEPEPCVSYAGCDDGYPVVWCQTTGQGHSRQDGLSAPAFWSFVNALPSLP